MNDLDFLLGEEVKAFIRSNVNSDPHKLILNPPKEFKDHIKQISGQIMARQKARVKLNRWATNFDLIMPPALSIEQASSQATCDYKKQLISGNHLVDLTGGMGIDCLALSERFQQTTYVEEQPNLCEVFSHNAKTLNKTIKIVNESAESFISNLDKETDEITFYLDPARRDDHKNRVFRIEDCSPNLIEILPMLKVKGDKVLVKFSPILDLRAIIEAINGLSEIHIVSVRNDCKEILLLIDFKHSSECKIRAINLESGQPNYSFNLNQEANSVVEYGDLKKYLFEPNSAIMKAGAFKKIAQDFGLSKLGENTHLYTSDRILKDYPGRTFEVVSLADKKSLSKFADAGKINVITRNYPLNANELKKKWKLNDGGAFFLVAFTDTNERPKMVIAQRIDSPK